MEQGACNPVETNHYYVIWNGKDTKLCKAKSEVHDYLSRNPRANCERFATLDEALISMETVFRGLDGRVDERTAIAVKRVQDLRASIAAIEEETKGIQCAMEQMQLEHENDVHLQQILCDSKTEALIKSMHDEHTSNMNVLANLKDAANSVCLDTLMHQHEESLALDVGMWKNELRTQTMAELAAREDEYNEGLERRLEDALKRDEEKHVERLQALIEGHRSRMVALENKLVT